MAWPASADAVVATANDMKTDVLAMFNDVAANADVAEFSDIRIDVDPLTPDSNTITVVVRASGVYSDAVADKVREVIAALGL